MFSEIELLWQSKKKNAKRRENKAEWSECTHVLFVFTINSIFLLDTPDLLSLQMTPVRRPKLVLLYTFFESAVRLFVCLCLFILFFCLFVFHKEHFLNY